MESFVANSSRRLFLKTSVIATGGVLGSGLIVGCAMVPAKSASAALPPSATAPGVMPNAWVKVGADNTVTIICGALRDGAGRVHVAADASSPKSSKCRWT